MYPPDAQNSTFLVPALDPMSIASYALPHTSAYHISKEKFVTEVLKHVKNKKCLEVLWRFANIQIKLISQVKK
jgi:hypothetical protein